PGRAEREEEPILAELLLIGVLVILNGVFAAAEIAVVSVRASRLEQLAREGSARARAVLELRKAPERFLATVQIGITVVSVVASAVGGATLASMIQPLFSGVPFLAEHARSISLAIVVVLVS